MKHIKQNYIRSATNFIHRSEGNSLIDPGNTGYPIILLFIKELGKSHIKIIVRVLLVFQLSEFSQNTPFF